MDIFERKLQELKKDNLQFQAFSSNQNTIVKAGPGSGKTTILTMKIADLLNNNIIEPRGLACITFTKDAAKEFSNRVNKLGVKPRKNVYLGTLHAFCITQIILPFKLTATKQISTEIITEGELNFLFKEVREKLITEYSDHQLPETQGKLDEYRSSNFEGISTVEIIKDDVWEIFVSLYEEELINRNKTDYLLLVKQTIQIIKDNSFIQSIIEAKFKWLLVDEYQDFNKLLHELVLSLREYTDIKLFIVGDPNQSIYSFMGGSHLYFDEFYEDDSFQIINLENNYRSTQVIVDAASQFLSIDDIEYKSKELSDYETKFEFVTCDIGWKDQVKYIGDIIIPICDKKGIPRSEICILVNNNYKSKSVQSELLKYNVKGLINKDEFQNNDFIQFIISVIKFVTTKDISFKTLFSSWLKIKFQAKFISNYSLINSERLFLYKAIEESKPLLNDSNKWIFKIIELIQLNSVLQSYVGKDNYIELKKIQDYFYEKTIISVSRKKEKLLPSDELIISTKHSSKGLEFDVIILLEMDNGVFPKSDEYSEFKVFVEEKRLFFVCITRARRDIYLLTSSYKWSNSDGQWEKISQSPSQFFDDTLNICKKVSVDWKETVTSES